MEEKLPMLKPGLYKAEHDGDIFHAYRYVMDVKTTEKSYIFKLMEKENRYADGQLETMFGDKDRIVIPRNRPARHAMRVWSDHDFTIYPFQLGVPFYFQKEDDEPEHNTGAYDFEQKSRNFATPERMAIIASNAINAFGQQLHGGSLYAALSDILKMSDKEILAAGFASLREFMTGGTSDGT